MGALTRASIVAGLALAAATSLLACSRGTPLSVDVVRLIATPPGVLPPTYTLADETRPVLALPPERRLDLPVPAGGEAAYTFTLPEDVAGDVIATGILQRAKHFTRCRRSCSSGAAMPTARRATLTLPEVALGPVSRRRSR